MQTLTLYHEQLGPLAFQGEAENSLVYDRSIITEIFYKGIDYLVSEELLTTEDRSTLQQRIDRMDIGLNPDLSSRSLITHQINPDTGEVTFTSYMLFSQTSQVAVVDMINTLLDDLCQLIVLLKEPRENLHGPHWVEYAEYLLPSYYIDEVAQVGLM